jgi:hypothetical protein
MTEPEAFSLYRPTGLPYSYHPVLLSGERAALGLASLSGRLMRAGDRVSASFGYWGSNIARGGFLAESARGLPAAAADHVERLVAPYFACAAEWYETVGIGVTRRPALRPWSGGGWATRSSACTSIPVTSSTWTNGQAPRCTRAPMWCSPPAWRRSWTSSRLPAPPTTVEPGRLPAPVLALTAPGDAAAVTCGDPGRHLRRAASGPAYAPPPSASPVAAAGPCLGRAGQRPPSAWPRL